MFVPSECRGVSVLYVIGPELNYENMGEMQQALVFPGFRFCFPKNDM